MSEFSGFPKSAFTFFRDLKTNNNRDWFTENKSVYLESVVEPAKRFVEALGEKLRDLHPYLHYDTAVNGSGSMFRIYRDVRFSKDKSPYKTHMGIVFWFDSGRKKTEAPGYYFGMSDGPPQIHGGHYVFGKDHLKAYRTYVLDVDRGNELKQILAGLEEDGFEVGDPGYKQVPRGFAKDHPHADLLLHKGVFVSSGKIPVKVAQSAQLVEACFENCMTMAPLLFWLREMEVQARLVKQR